MATLEDVIEKKINATDSQKYDVVKGTDLANKYIVIDPALSSGQSLQVMNINDMNQCEGIYYIYQNSQGQYAIYGFHLNKEGELTFNDIPYAYTDNTEIIKGVNSDGSIKKEVVNAFMFTNRYGMNNPLQEDVRFVTINNGKSSNEDADHSIGVAILNVISSHLQHLQYVSFDYYKPSLVKLVDSIADASKVTPSQPKEGKMADVPYHSATSFASNSTAGSQAPQSSAASSSASSQAPASSAAGK